MALARACLTLLLRLDETILPINGPAVPRNISSGDLRCPALWYKTWSGGYVGENSIPSATCHIVEKPLCGVLRVLFAGVETQGRDLLINSELSFPRLEASRLIMSDPEIYPVRLSIILAPCLTDHTSHPRSERRCDCHHKWVCGKSRRPNVAPLTVILQWYTFTGIMININ